MMKLLTKHVFLYFLFVFSLTACSAKSINKVALSALNEHMECVKLVNSPQQFCSLVSLNATFPSDDINVYFIDAQKGRSSLVITQSDFGSMFADVKLLNDDKYLIYGISQEGHLSYAIYLVDDLIEQGTASEPVFVIGEYGMIDILTINEQGKVLYEIDFHMKRPSLSCIENSPPEQCYIEIYMD